MKYSELISKKVIAMNEGKELGSVHDLDMNSDLTVTALIVGEKKRGIAMIIPWLFKETDEKIGVERITSIGTDVILVKKE